jgi:hypothetical protein
MWNLIVCKERELKQSLMMNSMKKGMPNTKIVMGDADPSQQFVCAGQLWSVERMIPEAVKLGTPFWMMDNGYMAQYVSRKPYNHHREFTYRGITPILIDEPDYKRMPIKDYCADWRYNKDGDVLICIPGQMFGVSLGFNMSAWSNTIIANVKKHTKKRIRLRRKYSEVPLEDDLRNASVIVTHSSHVAIDAIRRGVPAIVADTSPAAPVCSTSLEDIDTPWMPDRRHWWASLMCQHFTLEEMENGLAWRWMQRIMEQVDGN